MNCEIPKDEPPPCDLRPGDLEAAFPHADEACQASPQDVPGGVDGVDPLLGDFDRDLGGFPDLAIEPRHAEEAFDDELADNGFETDDEQLADSALAARAVQLEAESLGNDNHLQACFGALNSQLVRVADQQYRLLTQAMATAAPNLETLERLAKPLANFQSLHRQFDRHTQTQLRMEELELKSRQQSRPGPSKGISLDGMPQGWRPR